MSAESILADLYAKGLLILRQFWLQFRQLTPLWLAGVWLGATLSWVWPRITPRARAWPERLARTHPLLGLGGGALVGLLSPFSLLSLAGLLRPLAQRRAAAPALGLALANPLLNPTLLTFTALALGPQMAWAQALTAWLTAVVAGAILLCWKSAVPPISAEVRPAEQAALPTRMTWIGYLCHVGRELYWAGRHYLLALLAVAWIEALLPLGNLLALLGGGQGGGVLLAAGLGIPFYACGGGAVALVAELLPQGLSRGAALAFLAFGPATTVRTLAGLAAVGGRRMVGALVGTGLVVAVLAGLLLNLMP